MGSIPSPRTHHSARQDGASCPRKLLMPTYPDRAIVATETIYILIATLSCDQLCNDVQWLLYCYRYSYWLIECVRRETARSRGPTTAARGA